MEYKGYRIETRITTPFGIYPEDWAYTVWNNHHERIETKEGFSSFDFAIFSAKLTIDKLPNPYTPTNRPPYPWISVKDELPELDTTVFAIYKATICFGHFFGYASDHKTPLWDIDEVGVSSYYVTHWQYLPTLPGK